MDLRRRVALSPEGVSLLLWGASVIGYGFCLKVLLEHGIMLAGGEGAGDVFAYWTAGTNVRTGAPVYGMGVGGYAAFLYLPPLAQLFAPLSVLPFAVAVWIWRAVELFALRVVVGSWRATGIALLLWPPLISELDAGNVHLIMAAGVAMAIRGGGSGVLPTALTKYASLAAAPIAVRDDLRGFLRGIAIAAAICVVSFVIAPQLWFDYATFLPQVTTFDSGWYNLGATVPLPLRFGVAALLALLALRWARLAAVAATLALPVLWFHGLSMLIAVVARPMTREPDARRWRRQHPSLPWPGRADSLTRLKHP